MLEFASEQFVGKNPHDMEDIILQTIEGHFRAILGSFTNTTILISLFSQGLCDERAPNVGVCFRTVRG